MVATAEETTINTDMQMVMTTEQRYRDRAKDARDKAEASDDPDDRRHWLEIAKAFEQLAPAGQNSVAR